MTQQEDCELISSHRHIKITTIYRETINENNLKISRKTFPQLKIQYKEESKMRWFGEAEVWYSQKNF